MPRHRRITPKTRSDVVGRAADRRSLAAVSTWALWALVPLALAACGDAKSETARTTASVSASGAETTTTDAGTTTGPDSTDAEALAARPALAVSYEDAETAYREGNYEDAAALFEAYAASKPENPWGHYMLGLSQWKKGDPAKAERAFDRALELDPEHLKSYLNSARVLLDLGRAHEALERARIASGLDSTSEALRLVARAHHELGATDSAIAAYRQALLTDDRDVWAMNNLGLIYLEQDRPETALPPLARAVQLRSTSPVFQNNLGIALERTGHLVAAKQAYEAALRADSTYRKAEVSLARVTPLADSTTGGDAVDLAGIAEGFRLQIRMWHDNASAGPPEEPEAYSDVGPAVEIMDHDSADDHGTTGDDTTGSGRVETDTTRDGTVEEEHGC